MQAVAEFKTEMAAGVFCCRRFRDEPWIPARAAIGDVGVMHRHSAQDAVSPLCHMIPCVASSLHACSMSAVFCAFLCHLGSHHGAGLPSTARAAAGRRYQCLA